MIQMSLFTGGVYLSPTEIRIISCLGNGKSNRIIAYELGLAPGTVKVYFHSIFKKLGINNRTQAAIWAMNHINNDTNLG
jgi:two-component system nitrate/nitrite response regulator NarL